MSWLTRRAWMRCGARESARPGRGRVTPPGVGALPMRRLSLFSLPASRGGQRRGNATGPL